VCVELQAGIIEEMMDDAFESMEDQEELEEEAAAEVEKVLWELTAGVTLLHIHLPGVRKMCENDVVVVLLFLNVFKCSWITEKASDL